MRDQTAPTIANIVYQEYITRHGCPHNILSDQGTNFQSDMLEALYMLLDVDKRRTTPYRPQCDGQTERFNRTLGAMIRAVSAEHPSRWDELLKPLSFAYNTAVHKTTGVQPFVLLYGRLPRMPADLMFPPSDLQFPTKPVDSELIQHQYAEQVHRDLQAVYAVVREHRDFAVEKQKFFHDRRVKCDEYQLHDRVYCRREEPPQRGRSKKLSPRYDGPFEVVGRTTLDDGNGEVVINYKIKPDNGGRAKYVHVSKLKRCFAPRMEVITAARRSCSPAARRSRSPAAVQHAEATQQLDHVVRAHVRPTQAETSGQEQHEHSDVTAQPSNEQVALNTATFDQVFDNQAELEYENDEFEDHQLMSDTTHIMHLLDNVAFEDEEHDDFLEGGEEADDGQQVDASMSSAQLDESQIDYVPNYYYQQQMEQVVGQRQERPRRNVAPIVRLGID